MARARKNLAAVNDAITLDDPSERNGTLTLQMMTGGAGTVVIEGTMDDAQTPAAGDWISLKATNPNTKTDVDNIAAPGIIWAEDPGYNRVRARKTVGAAACECIFSKAYN